MGTDRFSSILVRLKPIIIPHFGGCHQHTTWTTEPSWLYPREHLGAKKLRGTLKRQHPFSHKSLGSNKRHLLGETHNNNSRAGTLGDRNTAHGGGRFLLGLDEQLILTPHALIPRCTIHHPATTLPIAQGKSMGAGVGCVEKDIEMTSAGVAEPLVEGDTAQ